MSEATLELARSLGVPMRGRHYGSAIGWTTNQETATALAEAGARTVFYRGSRLFHDPVDGWEIIIPVEPTEAATPNGEKES